MVAKSAGFIATHLTGALTLAAIAEAVEVTSFHLARVFAATTGHPVMLYVWRRRLC